jgi:ABC-2 type transport system ATP-binding protein
MSAVASVQTADGIRLEDLAKTFRGPNGPIHAVRGIDVSIAAGETVALLGPNGDGKSTTIDMLLGLAKPDRGTVSVFGGTPRDAVDAGLVGAMLQTGELIRDLTVREIIAMMASLYPAPMDVDAALQSPGSTTPPGSERRSSPADRPSASVLPSRWSATPTCWCSTSRRSRWTSRVAGSSG